MYGNKGGIGFAIIVIIIVALAFTYVLTVPQTTGFRVVTPTATNHQYENTTVLWANAAGWDYNLAPNNSSMWNPTLVYKVGTAVTFQVVEGDTAPHTLTINPGPNENRNTASNLLSITQITQTFGHKSEASIVFNKAGTYTYWCTVHPVTMVGTIIIESGNSTQNATSSITPAVHSSNNLQSLGNLAYSQNYFNLTEVFQLSIMNGEKI